MKLTYNHIRYLNTLNYYNLEETEVLKTIKRLDGNTDFVSEHICNYNTIPYIEKVSAGKGYHYGDNEVSTAYTYRYDLKDYDFATQVKGDSMYPVYNDGDIILVRSGYDNVNGDIYVIDYDGESYVKKLYNDGDRFRLISINRDYDTIIIDVPPGEEIYFNIVGKVVDSFTPIEI